MTHIAPSTTFDAMDAMELSEILDMLVELCDRAPNGIALSLWVCEMDSAYTLEELRTDLVRFAIKLGGGE